MSKNIVSGAVALLMVVVPSTAFALSQPSPFTMPVIPQNPTISELLDIVNQLTTILNRLLADKPTPPISCPVFNIALCAPNEHLEGGGYLPNGCQAAPRCVPNSVSTTTPSLNVSPAGGNAPLSVWISANNLTNSGTYYIDYGDGATPSTICSQGSSGVANCGSSWGGPHIYAVPGTFTVRLQQDPEGSHGNCYGPYCNTIASRQVVVTGTSTSSYQAGTLSMSISPATPALQLVPGGSTGVVDAAYTAHASGEAISLTKIGLTIAPGATYADLAAVRVYDGATLIGSATFLPSSASAVALLATPLQIPKDGDKIITIKIDVANIGISQPATSGHTIIILPNPDTMGVGVNSGSNIYSSFNGGNIPGVRIYRTVPTFALRSLSSSGLEDGKLVRYSVTASPAGNIGYGYQVFTVANAGASVSDVKLYAYTDASYSVLQRVMDLGPSPVPIPNSYAMNLSSPLEIPAGATYYFELRGTVVSTGSAAAVTTKVLGDTQQSMGMQSLGALTSNVRWSPNTNTTSVPSTADWTTGYMVPGLPADGLIQSRSGGSGTPTTTPTLNPTLTYIDTKGGGVQATYANLPANTQVSVMNQTTGGRVDGPSPSFVSGNGSLSINISMIPAGTYFLRAVNASTGAYVAQTVSFPYAGSESNAAPSCTITSDKSSYMYGSTITFSWTSTNATYAVFVPDLSGKDNLSFGMEKLSASGSQQVIATVTGNPYVTIRVFNAAGQSATCTKTVSVSAPPIPAAPSCTVAVSPTPVVQGGGFHIVRTAQNAVSRTSYAYRNGTLNNGGSIPVSANYDESATTMNTGSWRVVDTVTSSTGASATCEATFTVQAATPIACPMYNAPACPTGQTMVTDPVTYDANNCEVPHWHCATVSIPTPPADLCTFTPTSSKLGDKFVPTSSLGGPITMSLGGGQSACSTWCAVRGAITFANYTCTYNGVSISMSNGTSNISNIAFEDGPSGGTVAGVSISLDQQTYSSAQLAQVASVLSAIEGTLRTIIAEFGF